MIYYTVIVMDRLVFGLDQADVGKLHGAWNYIGSNSVKKRMKFKKILFHIHYIIRERIQLLNQFTSFTREKKVIFHDQMALLMAFGHS